MTDAEILAKVFSTPKLLWKVLTSHAKVLGPWQENEGYRWQAPGKARFTVEGDNLLVASKSMKLEAPQECQFHEWGGVDWEGLEEARLQYEEEKIRWKEWYWRFSHGNRKDFSEGYADSEEEAIELAEAHAKAQGYLLYNGD